MSKPTFNDAQPPYKHYYQAAAAANVIVKGQPGYLHSIIIGKFVSGGIIEVSDSATDGDGDVKIFLETTGTDTAFPKVIPVGTYFEDGITADITGSQSYVTFVYK